MIIYSKLVSLIFNLIVASAFVLAFKKMESLRGKLILLSAVVLVFVLPEIIQSAPWDREGVTLYIFKVGFGLFCLVYVRLKR